MKTSKKILSLLLAMLLVFSTSSVAFAGVLKTEDYTQVEELISKNGLASLVDSLFVNLNASKQNLIPPVLKIVFSVMDDEKLQDTIGTVIGKKDVADASSEELSRILIEWLNEMLPEWLGDTSSIEQFQPLAGLLQLDISDLSSVNGLLNTLFSVCTSPAVKELGDLGGLNGVAIQKTNRYDEKNPGETSLNVVKSLFAFLADEANRGVIRKVITGGIGRPGGLDIGSLPSIAVSFIDNFGKYLDKANNIIDNLPDFVKSYIYLLIDGKAEKGEITGNAKGGWGKSAYASYTADQMLAAALIRLIRKAEPTEVISKDDCNKALTKNFYELLSENLEPLYTNYDISDWLNENVKSLISEILITDDIRALYKDINTIDFKSASFNEKLSGIFEDAKTNGVIAQINNLVCIVAEEILTTDAYETLGLSNEHGNGDLNENLAKIFRMALPLMANDDVKNAIGYDFSEFTEEKVKGMNISQMAVAVLKLFFEDWFGASEVYDEVLVKTAFSLEQLAAYAVYFTTGLENVKAFLTDTDVVAALKAQGNKVNDITEKNATEFILDTGALIGLGALKANASKLHFSIGSTNGYKEIVDAVSDWGLNFIYGIPAVIKKECDNGRMTLNKGYYDDKVNGGPFYKINVVLNELIDFAFFTNDAGEDAPTSFKFDIGLFITDTLLDNLYTFDIAGILNAFEKNNNPTNILAKDNVVAQIMGVADRAVTALFKHDCTDVDEKHKTITTCTEQTDFHCTYCTLNGHFKGIAVNEVSPSTGHTSGKTSINNNGCQKNVTYVSECTKCHLIYSWEGTTKGECIDEVFAGTVAPTCTASGYDKYCCSICGKLMRTANFTSKSEHVYNVFVKTVAPTCTAKGYDVYKCATCSSTTQKNEKSTVAHSYVNGKCKNCGAADPSKPKVVYGDVDGDGEVLAKDARLVLRAAVGLEVYAVGSYEYLACDVDGEPKITASDARLVLRRAVGLDKSFPVENK